MTRNSALSDYVTNTNKEKLFPNLASSENTARVVLRIKYRKLLQLLSQELLDASSTLLQNPIHPIFQKRNWQISAQDLWPQLQPALRLASRFIGEDELLGFWYHLVWGRKEMQDVSKEFGYSLERFSAEGPPLDTKQKQQISLWLREYGERQQGTFLSFKAIVPLGHTTRTAANNVIVELQWEFFELLREHASGQKVLSETQLLTVNFVIAVTIIHELGHAVRYSVSHSIYEPYYGDHVLAEVGHAWGCYIFGGTMTRMWMPTTTETNCIYGLWVTTPPSPWQKTPGSRSWPASYPPPPVLGDLPNNLTSWVLTTAYIQRVQTEKFWEKDVKAHGVRALRVPPIGGIHDSQPLLKSNWMARVSLSRAPNDELIIEGCSLRDGV